MTKEITSGLHALIERPGVEHSEIGTILSTNQMFAALDRAVQKHQVVTLGGAIGSGKKFLLAKWATTKSKAAHPDQIIVISMSPAIQSLPPICIALSRIWDALEQLARPAYAQNQPSGARNIKMYSARSLENLRIAVQKALHDRNIKAIVIVRAHLLDEDGLNWLLDTRSYYESGEGFEPRFALILACTSGINNGEPTLIARLKKAGELKQKETRLTLPYIQSAEFAVVMGRLVRLNLNAVFHKDLNLVKVATDWFTYTSRIWSLLKEIALDVDEELGPAIGSEPRIITQEVLDRVYARFKKGGE